MRHRRMFSAAVAIAAAAVVTVATPGMAWAGGPGGWTQLSTNTNAPGGTTMMNIDEPSVARFANGLEIVWRHSQVVSGGPVDSVVGATVGGSGATTRAERTIVDAWQTLADNPRVVNVGGTRYVAFGGIRTTDANAPYAGNSVYYTTSATGDEWSLGEGQLTGNEQAYANDGLDAIDNAGTIATAVNAGSVATGVAFNQGTNAVEPDVDVSIPGAGCCAYSAGLVRDAATGTVYTAYYSNADQPRAAGIQWATVQPTVGTPAQAPGSYTTGAFTGSLSPDQRIATAARVGGGAYVAYKVGYPSTRTVRVLKLGTSKYVDVPGSSGAGRIAMGAGADGRLWVAWSGGSSGSAFLRFSRSNVAATRFSPAVTVSRPVRTDTVWHTALSAQRAVADLVVSAQLGSGPINVFHTQLKQRLQLVVPSRVRRGGTLVVKVTDAGDPVRGATVRVGTQRGVTGPDGTVRIRIPKTFRLGPAVVASSGPNYLGSAGRTTVLK